MSLADQSRPWWALDYGNQANYVINQGPGHRRTFGVVGVWHRDNGIAGGGGVTWSPLAGSASAWCGLRRHGDNTFVDPVTGNPFNQSTLDFNGENSPLAGGTSKGFPGYASQWDQMLYRDINISGAPGPNLTVSFKLRTRMSTGRDTASATRTGWFDKDPFTLASGNFISSSAAGASAPVDSFMVYIGVPMADTAGAEWTGSDGFTHPVFDRQRCWFGELVRANEPGRYLELFSTAGNNDLTVTRSIPFAALQGWGLKIRLVFRVKTNHGFDDQDSGESGYSSGGAGAAQVDDVTINLGSGAVLIGDFEASGSIDNSSQTNPLDVWKSTGKPPGIYFHPHDRDELLFQVDPATCNFSGGVISAGDHDLGEAAGGTYGTAEQERMDGIASPTINLASGGSGQYNNMGIDADLVNGTDDIFVRYDVYTGALDLPTYGNGWTIGVQSYPAVQPGSGTSCWSNLNFPAVQFTDAVLRCRTDVQGLRDLGLIHTSNPNGIPDSIRVFVGKQQQCFRFGLTTECGSTRGAYFDNVAVGFGNPSVQPCELSFNWEPGAAIKIVRPLAWWPNSELNRMRPGDVIAFSLLAEDRDNLTQTCSGCDGQQTVVSAPCEDLVVYDWYLRKGTVDGRIVSVDNARGSAILYQIPRCGLRLPGTTSRDTLECLISNAVTGGKAYEWWGSVPRVIITMSGCDSSTIQVAITADMGTGFPDQIVFGGGQNACLPSGPIWDNETPLAIAAIQQSEVEDFCPDYLTLLSVTAGDLDRYSLTCSPQRSGCLAPPGQTRSTVDVLHYSWSLTDGRGSFPLGRDGPAVVFRKSRSEDATAVCSITESGTQFKDELVPRGVVRTVIKAKPPRAFVVVGDNNTGDLPNPIKLADALRAAEVARTQYQDAGYEVTLSLNATVDTTAAVLKSPCYQAVWINGHGGPSRMKLNPGGDDPYFRDLDLWMPFLCPNPFVRELVALGCQSYSPFWDMAMVCGRSYSFCYDLYVGEEGSRLGRRPLDWERDVHRPIRAHDLRDE
jgi:hypothetical protein